MRLIKADILLANLLKLLSICCASGEEHALFRDIKDSYRGKEGKRINEGKYYFVLESLDVVIGGLKCIAWPKISVVVNIRLL